MKILVLGQGAREHALSKYFLNSAGVSQVYCAPGNAGMRKDGIICVPIELDEQKRLKEFVKETQIDWTFVGPEQPLIEGIVDYFNQEGLKIFGPSQKVAQLEGSKSFAKAIMKKYRIPTAEYEVLTNLEQALAALLSKSYPIVLKYDGLANGKGVVIAQNEVEAQEALKQFYQKESNAKVVIEEYMEGYEFSYHCLISENQLVPLITSQDYKRAHDGNNGKNTGGMGTFAPVPFANAQVLAEIEKQIVRPLIEGMKKEGTPYQGVLYVGVMWTKEGPKVIEFNVRFGDPETQVILPLLQTDLAEIIDSLLKNQEIKVQWKAACSVGVVVAADGYPSSEYVKELFSSVEITSPEQQVFYASVIEEGKETGEYRNEGGRILTLQQTAVDYDYARKSLYQTLDEWNHYPFFYRHDIAKGIK